MKDARPPEDDGKAGGEESSQPELPLNFDPASSPVNVADFPESYWPALARIRKDRVLYPLFRKVALWLTHERRGLISADMIEHEMKRQYGDEGLSFCHYTRTLMGHLFRNEFEKLSGRIASRPGALRDVPPEQLRGLLDEINAFES